MSTLPKPAADRIIAGVDPGTQITGYAFIHQQGSKLRLLACGVIQMGKSESDQPLKLKKIFKELLVLIDRHKPDELAVEAPFYGKNAQNLIKLGRAQGVVMAAALLRDVPVAEYAPRKVKKSVTGSGAASKEQVNSMVLTLLPEAKSAEGLKVIDASDALAVAICHYLQGNPVLAGSTASAKKGKATKAGSWGAFVKQNPGRVG